MKRFLVAVSTAVVALMGFTSCEKEVANVYQYAVSQFQVSELGSGASVGSVTLFYLSSLGWNEAETFDNEAFKQEDARKENDAEALQKYNENLAKFNMTMLEARYAQSGVTSAKGSFTYEVIRMEDQQVLASKVININYTAQ